MRRKIALFTACAPWEPLDALIPRLSSLGIAGLELACKPARFDPARPVGFWDNNAAVLDLDHGVPAALWAKSLLDAHGIACAGVGGYAEIGDTAHVNRLIAVGAALHAPWVRVRPPAPLAGQARGQLNACRTALEHHVAAAAAKGQRLAIEIHDRTLASSASGALRLIERFEPHDVAVILDVANLVREGGEDLAMAIDLLGPYLAHVHVKDVAPVADPSSWNGVRHDFRPLGQGVVRWDVVTPLLRDRGYTGWWSIENFSEVDGGVERLEDDAAFVRGLW